MRIDYDTPLSLPLAIGLAGLVVLTVFALVGINVQAQVWATWGGIVTASLVGGAARGVARRNGNGNGGPSDA